MSESRAGWDGKIITLSKHHPFLFPHQILKRRIVSDSYHIMTVLLFLHISIYMTLHSEFIWKDKKLCFQECAVRCDLISSNHTSLLRQSSRERRMHSPVTPVRWNNGADQTSNEVCNLDEDKDTATEEKSHESRRLHCKNEGDKTFSVPVPIALKQALPLKPKNP